MQVDAHVRVSVEDSVLSPSLSLRPEVIWSAPASGWAPRLTSVPQTV